MSTSLRAGCRAVIVVLLCCSCGGEDDVVVPTESFSSGERLRAEIYDLGDGIHAFRRWHDSALGEVCTFMPHHDGSWRCVPHDESERAHIGVLDVGFLDPACTQLVKALPGEAAVPAHATAPAEPPSMCTPDETRVGVYELGARVPNDTPIYQLSHDTAECVVLFTTSNFEQVYELRSEVPASTFVGAEEHLEPGERLASRALVAEDGSFERVGIIDSEREQSCQVFWTKDSPCVADRVAWLDGLFADSTCSSASAYSSAGAPLSEAPGCPPPSIAIDGSAACAEELPLYELGSELTGVYQRSGNTCSEASDNPSHRNYMVGARLPDDARPRVRDDLVGGAQLRLGVLRGEDDRILPLSRSEPFRGFYDVEVGAFCSLHELCDGTLGCDPGPSVQWFADPQCSEPLVELSTGCPSKLPHLVNMPVASSGCTTGELAEVGAPYPTDVVYGPDFDCQLTAYVPSPGSQLYRVTPSTTVRIAALTTRIE